MLNDYNAPVNSSAAGCEDELCFFSSAIDSFARALGYADHPTTRGDMGQPTLIMLNRRSATWSAAVRSVLCRTQRLVIAVDDDWLENIFDDDLRYDRAMAVAYELVGAHCVATDAKLHHSRTGKARLCSADLTQEYVLYLDGTGAWERLPEAFTQRASVGVQRAGDHWFFEHLEQDAGEFAAAMLEMEAEEAQVGSSVSLPGVELNMGRWRKPATGLCAV